MHSSAKTNGHQATPSPKLVEKQKQQQQEILQQKKLEEQQKLLQKQLEIQQQIINHQQELITNQKTNLNLPSTTKSPTRSSQHPAVLDVPSKTMDTNGHHHNGSNSTLNRIKNSSNTVLNDS